MVQFIDMNDLLKYIFVFVSMAVLPGCLARQVMLDRAVVINVTDGIISEVVVRHEPTGKVGAASMIIPRNSFDLGFSKQSLLAEEAIVSWRDQNGRVKKTVVTLPGSDEVTGRGQPVSLIYRIYPDGSVTVDLED